MQPIEFTRDELTLLEKVREHGPGPDLTRLVAAVSKRTGESSTDVRKWLLEDSNQTHNRRA